MKEIVKTDFGKIDFGQFKGTDWNNLNKKYLEYLCKDECNTDIKNKRIAKQILLQRLDNDHQFLIEFPEEKGEEYGSKPLFD